MRHDSSYSAIAERIAEHHSTGSVQDLYPEPMKQGDTIIEPVEVSALGAMRSLREREIYHCLPGTYTTLKINGQLWMSDTPLETKTNAAFIRAARGDVLIGGLGLGVILRPLLAKKQVMSVVIIENNRGVLDLVKPKFTDPRITYAFGDVKSPTVVRKLRERAYRFDCIWLDVWPNICRDYLPEMRALTKRYRAVLRRDGFIGCWGQREMELGRA